MAAKVVSEEAWEDEVIVEPESIQLNHISNLGIQT